MMRIILPLIMMLAFKAAYAESFISFNPKSILVSQKDNRLMITNKSGTYKRFIVLDKPEYAKFSKIYFDLLISQAIDENKDFVISKDLTSLYGSPSNLGYSVGICDTDYNKMFAQGFESYLALSSSKSTKGEYCEIRYGVILSPARLNFQHLDPRWRWGESKMQTVLDGKVVSSEIRFTSDYQQELIEDYNLILEQAKFAETPVLLMMGVGGFKVKKAFPY